METTDNALNQIEEVLQRTRQLAVEGANGSMSTVDMGNMKQEIGQLKTQLIHLANTTYAGRYIFSGFSTDSKLLNDDGSFTVSVSNNESIKYEIGVGDNININVLGGDLFNEGTEATAREKGKFITVFDDLLKNLNDGNHLGVSNRLGRY